MDVWRGSLTLITFTASLRPSSNGKYFWENLCSSFAHEVKGSRHFRPRVSRDFGQECGAQLISRTCTCQHRHLAATATSISQRQYGPVSLEPVRSCMTGVSILQNCSCKDHSTQGGFASVSSQKNSVCAKMPTQRSKRVRVKEHRAKN